MGPIRKRSKKCSETSQILLSLKSCPLLSFLKTCTLILAPAFIYHKCSTLKFTPNCVSYQELSSSILSFQCLYKFAQVLPQFALGYFPNRYKISFRHLSHYSLAIRQMKRLVDKRLKLFFRGDPPNHACARCRGRGNPPTYKLGKHGFWKWQKIKIIFFKNTNWDAKIQNRDNGGQPHPEHINYLHHKAVDNLYRLQYRQPPSTNTHLNFIQKVNLKCAYSYPGRHKRQHLNNLALDNLDHSNGIYRQHPFEPSSDDNLQHHRTN